MDITPLSLGIETARDIMTNLIERNTTIPIKNRKYLQLMQKIILVF